VRLGLAFSKLVAVPVNFKYADIGDADMVGEPINQPALQALRAEGFHRFLELQIANDQSLSALVAKGDQFVKRLRPCFEQQYKANDKQRHFGEGFLQSEKPFLVTWLHQLKTLQLFLKHHRADLQ